VPPPWFTPTLPSRVLYYLCGNEMTHLRRELHAALRQDRRIAADRASRNANFAEKPGVARRNPDDACPQSADRNRPCGRFD
jgi:hypothetical protein